MPRQSTTVAGRKNGLGSNSVDTPRMKAILLTFVLTTIHGGTDCLPTEDQVEVVEFHRQHACIPGFMSVNHLVFWRRLSIGNLTRLERCAQVRWDDHSPECLYDAKRGQWYLYFLDCRLLYTDESGEDFYQYYPRKIWFQEFWKTDVPYRLDDYEWNSQFVYMYPLTQPRLPKSRKVINYEEQW